MTDRTLVAYARDGGYDLHRAPRPPSISAARPFGGTADRAVAERVRALLRERGIEAVAGALVDPPATVVDPRPVGRVEGTDFAAVARACRFGVYDRVVRARWTGEALETTRFLALWFGPPGESGEGESGERGPGDAGDGALLALAPGDGAEWLAYTRGWFAGVKTATWDAVRAGRLDPAGARAYLGDRVREYAGDRETYVPATGRTAGAEP